MSRTREARMLRSRPLVGLGAERTEIVAGLLSPTRRLPARYFYDARGAALFEAITRTDAYYLTRAELEILRSRVNELARRIGPQARIIEFGSGSGAKTQILLDAVEKPATYVPVDLSREQLEAFAATLRQEHEGLTVLPVCADYTCALALPTAAPTNGRTILFFPGSTIGNLEPDEARAFLARCARLSQEQGFMIVGVDLVKDRATLELAYNDPEGITAAFNLNILSHVNRLFGTDFDTAMFSHYATFNESAGRIEMHLVSKHHQAVTIPLPDRESIIFELQRDEPIVTEHSYKYDISGFQRLARCAGFEPDAVWTDANHRFAVHLLHGPGVPESGS